MDSDASVSGVVEQDEDEPGDNAWEEAAGVRRTLYLSVELSSTLARVAQEQGVTVNDLIVAFITEGLRRLDNYQGPDG
jgi:hypothetical protein